MGRHSTGKHSKVDTSPIPGTAADDAAATDAAQSAEPHLSPARNHTRAAALHASKRRRRNRIAKAVVSCVAVVVCAVGVAAGAWVSSLQSSMAYEEEEFNEVTQVLAEDTEDDYDEPYYVLILGSDARTTGATSRSDTIILARVDEENSLVTLVSIPRDTIVDIEGYGTNKINAAYAYGGASLAIEVIGEYAGVEISHCVEVYFEECIDVVDSIGGIEIDVEESIDVEGVTIGTGLQTLSGTQALAYARDRKHVTGGDFGRAKAQREVIMAVANKVLSMSATKIPATVREIAECVTTDYTIQELLALASTLATSEDGLTFYSAICPSYTYSYGSGSYVATMYDEWREMMQRVDAGLDPNDEDAQVPLEQSENINLGAATNALGPSDYESYASGRLTTDSVEDDEDEDDSDSEGDVDLSEFIGPIPE